jgi:hypothetical protein
VNITVSPRNVVAYEERCEVCGRRLWLDWPWPFGKTPVAIKYETLIHWAGGVSKIPMTQAIYTHGGKCKIMGIFQVMNDEL